MDANDAVLDDGWCTTYTVKPAQPFIILLKAKIIVFGVGLPGSQVVAATTRGIPESVSPPNITAQGPETLRLSWSVPEKTKDVIKEYQLWLDGRGLISADTGDSRQHTVTGDKTGNLLEEAVIAVGLGGAPPGVSSHTQTTATLAACTSARCTSTEPSVGQTLQAALQGNQDGSVVQRKHLYMLF
ncbi:Ush2a [Lemmus lemmus]